MSRAMCSPNAGWRSWMQVPTPATDQAADTWKPSVTGFGLPLCGAGVGGMDGLRWWSGCVGWMDKWWVLWRHVVVLTYPLPPLPVEEVDGTRCMPAPAPAADPPPPFTVLRSGCCCCRDGDAADMGGRPAVEGLLLKTPPPLPWLDVLAAATAAAMGFVPAPAAPTRAAAASVPSAAPWPQPHAGPGSSMVV